MSSDSDNKLPILKGRTAISEAKHLNFRVEVLMVTRAICNVVMSSAVLFSVVSFAAGGAPQEQKAAHLPGSNPVSGARLYKQYCAVCHGNDLKGNGPVSPEFKNPPSDLTTLAQRHEGKFPDAYVEDVLRNGVKKPAHGNTEMPVWG
ncbi:MAG: cytochrome c, partial [Candidatus Acidiferrales bacterium]